MSITIKQNIKPNLSHCEMICDKGLHPKLNEFELTKFMNSHETNLLIGRPGSGKTSLLYSLFKSRSLFNKVFHNIYLFQPSHSRASMKDNLFDKIPDNQKFNELTFDYKFDLLVLVKHHYYIHYLNLVHYLTKYFTIYIYFSRLTLEHQ